MSIVRCNLEKFKFSKIKVIEILNKAISKIVDDEYVIVPYHNVERRSQKPERVFVAELYHQLRCIQESKTHSLLKDLKFNVEINKQGHLRTEDPFIDSYKIKRVIPDLILHFNQDDRSREKQLLVCEVKSSYSINQSNFEKDVIKLLLYRSNRFNYQFTCFIFLGTKKELCSYVSVLNEQFIERIKKEKIIFITRDDKKWNFYEYK